MFGICVNSDLEDVTSIHSEERKCIAHGEPCELPTSLDIFAAGFSCTSVSGLNPGAAENVTAIEQNKAWV